MPVTSGSELAQAYFKTGMLAFDQVKLAKSMTSFEMAVSEDPDFFMAYFWMYFISGKSSKKIADRALQSETELCEGEVYIRTAFKYLLDGQNEKVVENLQKVIDLYPGDPDVHKILYILQFQYFKDIDGALESIYRAIDIIPDYPLAYNQLGYAMMDLEDFNKAEEAFNNYIRLAPAIANPYDSKGDYYMTTEQYPEAYESYIRAFEIDSGFKVSAKKAQKAKQMMDKPLE